MAEQMNREEWVIINDCIAALVIGFDGTAFLIRPEKLTAIHPGDIVRRRGFTMKIKSCNNTVVGDWWIYPE